MNEAVGYMGENARYLKRNGKLIRCPVCGRATLTWENWGLVRTGEEYGLDEPLKIKCASCGSIFNAEDVV